jgi:hypothetical protein
VEQNAERRGGSHGRTGMTVSTNMPSRPRSDPEANPHRDIAQVRNPRFRIAITAAAYAAIRESLPVAKSRRYAPQKAGGALYLVSVPQ